MDTLYFLERENVIETANFWKGDIGFNYFLNDWFSFSISSINLLNFGEQTISEDNEQYKIRTDKAASLRLSFLPFAQTSFNFLYETNNSFQLGMNKNFNVYDSEIGLSIAALHDKYQSPFINGFLAGLSYSNDMWGVTLSGVKYFKRSNRSLFHF
ncbi:MAG: hypothetical protein MZV64_61510 [Ignavibacteriales bacterium]|nr:hypothetical protein [Ignavibacteriales bacterium]